MMFWLIVLVVVSTMFLRAPWSCATEFRRVHQRRNVIEMKNPRRKVTSEEMSPIEETMKLISVSSGWYHCVQDWISHTVLRSEHQHE